LKVNIAVVNNSLSKLSQLQGIYYTLKQPATIHTAGKRQVGLIAQEVQKVLPEVVLEMNDPEHHLAVKYTELIPVIIEAIHELENSLEMTNNTTVIISAIPTSKYPQPVVVRDPLETLRQAMLRIEALEARDKAFWERISSS